MAQSLCPSDKQLSNLYLPLLAWITSGHTQLLSHWLHFERSVPTKTKVEIIWTSTWQSVLCVISSRVHIRCSTSPSWVPSLSKQWTSRTGQFNHWSWTPQSAAGLGYMATNSRYSCTKLEFLFYHLEWISNYVHLVHHINWTFPVCWKWLSPMWTAKR